MNKPKTRAKEQQAYKLINEIIHQLRDPSADLPQFLLKKKLNHYTTGWCDYNKITLGVFYDFIPTLFHEMTHYIHDNWSETKVIQSEKLIKRYIKIKDVILILKLFLDVI